MREALSGVTHAGDGHLFDKYGVSSTPTEWTGLRRVSENLQKRNKPADKKRQQCLQHKKNVTGLIVTTIEGASTRPVNTATLCHKFGAKMSMSRHYDNAAMESSFPHLKMEALYLYSICSVEEAQQRFDDFIREMTVVNQ
ncbi:hypothetical protein [Paenibacillus humicola]|uniref:hypothetical protein n=1 Tax=Paenibacillus humicola TaxID=3110540 RepID=UPI00237A0AAD|nr:hypothetical protein [Paenibacillus humicola]